MTLRKNIAILGSTGSIGQSALEVIRALPELNVVALSGFSNLDRLVEQAREFSPQYLVAADREIAEAYEFPELPGTEIDLREAGFEQRRVPFDVQGCLNVLGGALVLPQLRQQDAEQVQCIGVSRFVIEHRIRPRSRR